MKSLLRLILTSAACLVAAVLLISPAVQAEPPKKVLLVPFALFAGDDLAYLQQGIAQMLTSRLTQDGKVQVIPIQGQVDPGVQAKSVGADYLVSGSVTLLGSSVSTDAKVMDINQNKQVLTFSRVGKDQADIIDHVDQLATQINLQLFGRQAEAAAPGTSAPTASAAPGQDPSIYQHPEKLISQPGEGDELNRYGDVTGFVPAASLLLRGRREAIQMRGVTAADVDGDGRNDIVCIGQSSVIAYRVTSKGLAKLAQLDAVGNYIGVDALDVNGNGKAEIFVTNFANSNSQVHSFVLEWNGKELVRIADGLNWYFRAVEVPNRGRILAGQRQGLNEPFGKGIHEMGWQSGAYEPIARLPLPRDLNIFGFAFGAIRTPHDIEVAAYNSGGFVQLLNRRGDEQWLTSERFGGSPLFIDFASKEDTDERDYIYLPPRIQLYDLDGDGLQEIFVINNENSAGAFRRVRLFKNGRLEGLHWDSLGMTPLWRTRSLAKYFADFAFADMDGDGQPEIVAAVVQKDNGTVEKGRSYLAVFKLAKPSGKKEG